MRRTMYRVDRRVVGRFYTDHLSRPWEGDDLPAFHPSDPYLFESLAEARRVCWRLQSQYAEHAEMSATPELPARPISYSIMPVNVKPSYFLPATGDPVTRGWVAAALRKARRHRLPIISSSRGEHHISFGPCSRALTIRRLADVPAPAPAGWDVIEA